MKGTIESTPKGGDALEWMENAIKERRASKQDDALILMMVSGRVTNTMAYTTSPMDRAYAAMALIEGLPRELVTVIVSDIMSLDNGGDTEHPSSDTLH